MIIIRYRYFAYIIATMETYCLIYLNEIYGVEYIHLLTSLTVESEEELQSTLTTKI